MTRLKASLLTLCTALLLAVPLGGTAGACPDPDNPCDPQPIDPRQELCEIIGKYC